MDDMEILKRIKCIKDRYCDSLDTAPEQMRPNIDISSKENYTYYTLPLAISAQRDKYELWKSAKHTFEDIDTTSVFRIDKVMNFSFEKVKRQLQKHNLANKPSLQTEIWVRLCNSIKRHCRGDIRNIFKDNYYDIIHIKFFMKEVYKQDFPSISGDILINYWLYIIYKYTDVKFRNPESLSIIPDSKIVEASNKLGIITDEEINKTNRQIIVINRWKKILKKVDLKVTEIQEELWQWCNENYIDIF